MITAVKYYVAWSYLGGSKRHIVGSSKFRNVMEAARLFVANPSCVNVEVRDYDTGYEYDIRMSDAELERIVSKDK